MNYPVPTMVATIVINWNGKAFLQACLPDLLAQAYPHHRVIVVDNGSTDGSQFWLRAAHPDIQLVELYANTGFAHANNVGIALALEDPETSYIALVNNDTRVPPDWLSNLVSALNTHPGYWAAQTPLVLEHDPQVINSLGIAIDRSLWARDAGASAPLPQALHEAEVFGVTAGAALFRRTDVEDLLVEGALFDPRFFAYYEDVDLAFRARHRGFRSLLVPHPPVRHVASGTGGKRVGRKVFFLERNHWFYVIKDVPLKILIHRLPMFVGNRFSRSSQWLKPLQWRVFIWSLLGNLAWIPSLPYLLKARRRVLRRSTGSVREALALRPDLETETNDG